MVKFQLIIVVIYLVIRPATCVSSRRISEHVQTLHRTGVSIAVANLIQEYEEEHFEFYKQEIGKDDHLGWPDLNKKNLSLFCRKFLQQTIPDRKTSDTIGFIIRKTLHYEKVNTNHTSQIIIVQCNVMRKRYNLTYYITRAPKPNCVYALKSMGNWNYIVLNIINKYCDFEDRQLLNNPLKRKREGDSYDIKFKTAQPIAEEEYILEYELEHQKLLKQEGNNGTLLEWPDLDKKNLFNYCRKYLRQITPARDTGIVIGMTTRRTLHYEINTTSTTSEVIIVQCTITSKSYKQVYYITRALKPNCVYALKSTEMNCFIFTIINKYCDFENQQSTNRSIKWKGEKSVHMMHPKTGQPIAKDECLLKFELEHQELHKAERNTSNHMKWPHVIAHPNLDIYCYQYVKECAPNRNREGLRGTWKTEILYYHKINTSEKINVTTVTCHTSDLSTRNYHMTRAPETNCVYALLRKGRRPTNPLTIIFKHCDFEILNN